jgi:hypothetical protein
MSESLLNSCRSCNIAAGIPSKQFDHKSITLDFTADKIKPKLFINRSIISNPRTEDVVFGAFADTYLAHADPAQLLIDEHVHHQNPGDQLDQQKGKVGRFLELIREYNDLTLREVNEPNNNLIPLLKAGTVRNLDLQRDVLWNIDKFSSLKLTCSSDFFLEALASNIKGSVISFQTFVKKMENLKKSRIVKRLNELKVDYGLHFDEISALEGELNSIQDAKTLIKVQSMK